MSQTITPMQFTYLNIKYIFLDISDSYHIFNLKSNIFNLIFKCCTKEGIHKFNRDNYKIQTGFKIYEKHEILNFKTNNILYWVVDIRWNKVFINLKMLNKKESSWRDIKYEVNGLGFKDSICLGYILNLANQILTHENIKSYLI